MRIYKGAIKAVNNRNLDYSQIFITLKNQVNDVVSAFDVMQVVFEAHRCALNCPHQDDENDNDSRDIDNITVVPSEVKMVLPLNENGNDALCHDDMMTKTIMT